MTTTIHPAPALRPPLRCYRCGHALAPGKPMATTLTDGFAITTCAEPCSDRVSASSTLAAHLMSNVKRECAERNT